MFLAEWADTSDFTDKTTTHHCWYRLPTIMEWSYLGRQLVVFAKSEAKKRNTYMSLAVQYMWFGKMNGVLMLKVFWEEVKWRDEPRHADVSACQKSIAIDRRADGRVIAGSSLAGSILCWQWRRPTAKWVCMGGRSLLSSEARLPPARSPSNLIALSCRSRLADRTAPRLASTVGDESRPDLRVLKPNDAVNETSTVGSLRYLLSTACRRMPDNVVTRSLCHASSCWLCHMFCLVDLLGNS